MMLNKVLTKTEVSGWMCVRKRERESESVGPSYGTHSHSLGKIKLFLRYVP